MKSNIVTVTNPQNRDHSAAPCFAIKESCVVPGRSRHHQEDLDVENISVPWCQAEPALAPGCVEVRSRQEIGAQRQISGKS